MARPLAVKRPGEGPLCAPPFVLGKHLRPDPRQRRLPNAAACGEGDEVRVAVPGVVEQVELVAPTEQEGSRLRHPVQIVGGMGLIEAPLALNGLGWSVDSGENTLGKFRHQTPPTGGVVFTQRFAVGGPHLAAAQPPLVLPEARLGEQWQDLKLSATSTLE